MIREEIVEGLKVALSRGEPLRRAMMTFYNAGYKREDIEHSARSLQVSPQQLQQLSQQPAKKTPPVDITEKESGQEESEKTKEEGEPSKTYSQVQQLPVKNAASPQKIKGAVQQQPRQIPVMQKPLLNAPRRIQKVSDYDKKPSRWTSVVIFILVFVLLFLVGALVAVFLFRNEITELLNNLL